MPTSRVLVRDRQRSAVGRRRAVVAALGLSVAGLLGAAGPAAAKFEAAGVTPSPLVGPGSAEFRFTITGVDVESTTEFSPVPLDVKKSAFGGASASVDITGVRLEGAGTLRVESTAMAAMVPSCRRGSIVEAEWTRYRLDLPATATATVVVTAKVPSVLPGGTPGVRINHGAPVVPGRGTPDILYMTDQTAPTNSYVDGVSLTASKRTRGQVRVSGRVIPARAGAKVTFVTRPSSRPTSVDSVFGMPESLRTPTDGLKVVGSARTTKGGKYSATVRVKSGVALAARTGGEHAGGSCGVFVG